MGFKLGLNIDIGNFSLLIFVIVSVKCDCSCSLSSTSKYKPTLSLTILYWLAILDRSSCKGMVYFCSICSLLTLCHAMRSGGGKHWFVIRWVESMFIYMAMDKWSDVLLIES